MLLFYARNLRSFRSYLSFGGVSVGTLDTAPGFAVEARVTRAAVGELGLFTDVAHVARVD